MHKSEYYPGSETVHDLLLNYFLSTLRIVLLGLLSRYLSPTDGKVLVNLGYTIILITLRLFPNF